MRVIVAGSRSITDYALFCKLFGECWLRTTEIVVGGANGVDSMGEKWAIDRGIKFRKFLPDWDLHGKSAGCLRNIEMAKYASSATDPVWDSPCPGGLFLLWNGKSRGSAHMLSTAIKEMLYICERRPDGYKRDYKPSFSKGMSVES